MRCVAWCKVRWGNKSESYYLYNQPFWGRSCPKAVVQFGRLKRRLCGPFYDALWCQGRCCALSKCMTGVSRFTASGSLSRLRR